MSPPTGKNAHIKTLTAIITQAVDEIIAEYAAVGQEVPSLDSTAPGSFDSPEMTPLRLVQAVQRVEAACAQLSFTVASPGHVIVNKSLEHNEPACLLVVTEARIADLLLDKPEGVHVEELADAAKLDSGKLRRIMRLLATKHCFKEVKPDVFANNRLSMKLLSTEPVSSIVSLLTDESLKASAYLQDNLAAGGQGCNTPFERAYGNAFFDYYKTPQGKRQGERFPRAMVGWGEVTGKGLVATAYPWSSTTPDTSICDVAGGNGHVTLGLMKAFPHLKVVLQDQPATIEQGKELWKKEYPEAVEKDRVRFVPFNFFEDVAVKDCDFYYIRSILRDWPDAESIKILTNVRKAMKPSSKLIIHDTVLQHAVRSEDNINLDKVHDQAPEPLLPNYGVARVRTYELDMTMMNLLNAQARTLKEFIDLCGKCGLKYSNIYNAGETDLVEFLPVDV